MAELDRFIVGQAAAKRSVAIAVRNRWRRQQLDEEMRREVAPKNILMIGPTGVGKTEIARRLARDFLPHPLSRSRPVNTRKSGYYGRDVESMIRELGRKCDSHRPRARARPQSRHRRTRRVESQLLDILAPLPMLTDAR